LPLYSGGGFAAVGEEAPPVLLLLRGDTVVKKGTTPPVSGRARANWMLTAKRFRMSCPTLQRLAVPPGFGL
jgi:hypothetical protein